MEHRILCAAVFLLFTFSEVISQNCPELYQRYHVSHTYCRPLNQTCNRKRSGLTQEEIDQVVKEHNDYRKIIANQQKGNRGLPPASDMLMMEWDNELARVAQRHADQCIYAHDENDQRRVQNFGVGQNMAKAGPSNRQSPPDWPRTIKKFFGEIANFSKSNICGPRSLKGVGHFTQLTWSGSYRVGCGFTQYKTGNNYIELYVCNYGPAGNDDNTCVYEEGPACSNCPENTQCDEKSGLCKRTNNKGPYKPDKQETFFNCNFRDYTSSDCQISSSGDGTWNIYEALDGNYLEIVLQPGENGTIKFINYLTPPQDPQDEQAPMCIQIRSRKGPNLAKNPENNLAEYKVIAHIPGAQDFPLKYNFDDQEEKYRQYFLQINTNLKWRYPTELVMSFAVPRGSTAQFFNLASVVGIAGRC